MTPIETAISAALGAGKILKKNLGKLSKKDIQDKKPFDFVTAIDKKAEKFIINFISNQFPDHGIFAEETGRSKHNTSHRWIIDPLDGTTNFIHGYPNFSVSIAFESENKIIAGVVYDPIRDELFLAQNGKGAFLNDKKISVSQTSNTEFCLIATGFPFKNKNFLTQYWNVLSEIFMEVSGIRRTGSAALDLANVACGRFDGFWEMKLSPWDVAAGSLLIEQAGGKITDFEENSNHIFTGNVVASNGLIHNFLLEKINAVFANNP